MGNNFNTGDTQVYEKLANKDVASGYMGVDASVVGNDAPKLHASRHNHGGADVLALTHAEISDFAAYPPPLVAGGYHYTSQGLINYSTVVNPANGLVTYIPFIVAPGSSGALKELGVFTTGAASAGGKCRVGIYNDNGSGQPGTVAVDGGQIDSTVTAGYLSVVIAVTLAPGLYWLAAGPQGAPATTGTYKTMNTSVQITPTDNTTPGAQFGFRSTGITGAFAANPTIAGGTATPIVVWVNTT